MTMIVIMGIIGALAIGVSFYFLLKEDGSEDQYSGFFMTLGAILMAPCVLIAIVLWVRGLL